MANPELALTYYYLMQTIILIRCYCCIFVDLNKEYYDPVTSLLTTNILLLLESYQNLICQQLFLVYLDVLCYT